MGGVVVVDQVAIDGGGPLMSCGGVLVLLSVLPQKARVLTKMIDNQLIDDKGVESSSGAAVACGGGVAVKTNNNCGDEKKRNLSWEDCLNLAVVFDCFDNLFTCLTFVW